MDDGDAIIAKNDNVRLVNYGVLALFNSDGLSTISGKLVEYVDHCHPNLLMYKLLISTENEYDKEFVRGGKLKDDDDAA